MVRVAFSPDATKLLTVGDGHAAWVWDTASGRCLCALAEHKQKVRFGGWAGVGCSSKLGWVMAYEVS